MHYVIFRSITRLQTVLQHPIHCKHQFRICKYFFKIFFENSQLRVYFYTDANTLSWIFIPKIYRTLSNISSSYQVKNGPVFYENIFWHSWSKDQKFHRFLFVSTTVHQRKWTSFNYVNYTWGRENCAIVMFESESPKL